MASVVYRRRRGTLTKLVDGEAFIITKSTIQHLNASATFIWMVLSAAAPHRDILAMLQELYPQVPRATLSADVRRTLGALRKMRLVTGSKSGS
ncbi:PqqD family protein [Aestuariivirga sp.]|uniref:PqqD family protein n=1 Tax=Aestuariivirga sp. TaxID=2650926 RepID=UPI003593B1C7